MEYTGKRNDVVDFGGEADYGEIVWFADPPPKPPPASPQPAQPAYQPPPGVVEQNEMFDYALLVAPNVLYGRYKQYGQLGVLAWCSEFAELIDNLKELGVHGHMFVSTRRQAFQTCEQVLKLKLEIKMQIIVLYLSSQVSRLRRFLDNDRTWNDYPETKFPVDPRAYQ
ncbi:hypothetical protein APHAL10511_006065 [Amanita phalloides]|nr:hypothetical protein APHAL10511_006065 [Amanita phalloides]